MHNCCSLPLLFVTLWDCLKQPPSAVEPGLSAVARLLPGTRSRCSHQIHCWSVTATWSYVWTPYDRTGRVIRQPSTNVLFMSYFILLMFLREKTLQPLFKMSKSWTPLETLELTSVDVGLFGWVCFVISPPPQRACLLFIRMIPVDSDSTWGTAPFSPKAPADWQTFAHPPLSSCPASQASDKPALVRQEAWLNAEKSGLGKTSPHAAPLSQRENRGQAA